jgi:hypothetical protein
MLADEVFELGFSAPFHLYLFFSHSDVLSPLDRTHRGLLCVHAAFMLEEGRVVSKASLTDPILKPVIISQNRTVFVRLLSWTGIFGCCVRT